jgi:hypothetical protein
MLTKNRFKTEHILFNLLYTDIDNAICKRFNIFQPQYLYKNS